MKKHFATLVLGLAFALNASISKANVEIFAAFGKCVMSGDQPVSAPTTPDCNFLYQMIQSTNVTSLNEIDSKDNTILINLSALGYERFVDLLISKKVDLNIQGNNGITALLASLINNRKFPSIAQKLILAGSSVNAYSKNNDGALFLSSEGGFSDLVILLLSKGANPNVLTIDGKSPLSAAVNLRNEPLATTIVEALLAAGASPKLYNSESDPPLVIAARRNRLNFVTQFLALGVDPNAPGGFGTALFETGNAQVASALIQAHADVHYKGYRNLNVVSNACRWGFASPDYLKVILTSGADVDNLDDGGYTPLLHAAYCEELLKQGFGSGCANLPNYVSLLVNHHAQLNAQVQGDKESALMLLAAQKKFALQAYDAAEILLKAGANPSISYNGRTALSIAKTSGNLNFVKLLKKYGAH